MTIRGDLATVLSARLGCTYDEARAHLTFILMEMTDPNFALTFERELEEPAAIYWQVIKFLAETV